jgi:hypothetical protein
LSYIRCGLPGLTDACHDVTGVITIGVFFTLLDTQVVYDISFYYWTCLESCPCYFFPKKLLEDHVCLSRGGSILFGVKISRWRSCGAELASLKRIKRKWKKRRDPANLLNHLCPSDQVLARDDIHDDLDMERNLSILIAVTTTLYTESTSAVTAGQEFPSGKTTLLELYPEAFRDTHER